MSDATVRWQARRIEELEALVAELRADLSEARDAGNQWAALAVTYKLTPQEARLLARLWRGRNAAVVTYGQCRAGMGGCATEDNHARVIMSRLRAKLPFPVARNVHSLGYRLSQEAIEHISKVLGDAPALTGRAA